MAEIFLLALASAVNPTMLAAVTLMLTLERPERLLLGYLLGGMLVSVGPGLVLVSSSAGSDLFSSSKELISPTLDLVLGLIALLVGYVLATDRDARLEERRRHRKQQRGDRKPWSQRVLGRGSARVAFALGAMLNLPGLYYLLALGKIDQAHYGAGAEVMLLIAFNLIMFTLAEVPLLGYAIAPDRTRAAVGRFNHWLVGHARKIAIAVVFAAAIYLCGRGMLGLLT